MIKSGVKICLVGQVYVDCHIFSKGFSPVLGGVFHAARTLAGLGIDFSIGYLAPAYLDGEIRRYASILGAMEVEKIGNILGAPNTLLIGEPKEIGNQRYEDILWNERTAIFDSPNLVELLSKAPSDVLIFNGGFDLSDALCVLQESGASVHLDAVANPMDVEILSSLGRSLSTLILSTSSEPFREGYQNSISKILDVFSNRVSSILLKENRGGARLFSGRPLGTNVIHGKAFPRSVFHSVGVGDCFNVIFLALRSEHKMEAVMNYASLVAAEYAATFDIDVFAKNALAALKIPEDEIISMEGNSVPWDDRSEINVYIAAPDFDAINRSHIEQVAHSLSYHNFIPRLPVQENGEISIGASNQKKRKAAQSDFKLLDECDICFGVLEYNDPGTLIELGYAHKAGIPILVYDPHCLASNLMLTQTPRLVSSDLDELITEVFTICSRLEK